MSAQVVALPQRRAPSHDWRPSELAQFYRVESALIQAGLQLDTERGVSDEGDPWFAFCRADTGEVFIHFARIDGQYIAIGAALDRVIRGRDFPALVQEMLAANAWSMAARTRQQSNVFLHPSALLIALVGAAFFHSGEVKAAAVETQAQDSLRRHALPILIQDSGVEGPTVDAAEAATILSGVLSMLGDSALSQASAVILASAATAWEAIAPAPEIVTPVLTGSHAVANGGFEAVSADVAPLALTVVLAHSTAAGDDLALTPSAPAPSILHVIGADLTPLAPAAVALAHVSLATPMSNEGVVLLMADGSDAAQLVQASQIQGDFGEQSVAAPVLAPHQLTQSVKSGEHVTLTGPPGPAPLHVGSTAGEVGSAQDGASSPAPLVENLGGVALTLASATSIELSANASYVTAAVSHFAAEVATLDISSAGRDIILYDGAILHGAPAGTQIESFTFDFSDGSAISLVGTSAELHSLHLPVPVS